jgi:crotonobetainyl-CoA:carnitine CoA-transferase CaiB-like acyl-CoA transferase
MLAEVDQPTYEAHGGRVRMLGFPFRASATPASIRRPAPLLGEHTAEVLREVLDLSPAEISALAESGAIRLAPPS